MICKRREYELLSIQLEEDAETIKVILEKASECSSEGARIEAFTRAELDQLWTASTPELKAINKHASRHDAKEKALAARGVLTESGRAALNKLLVQLLEPAAVLAKMSDDGFQKHYLETVKAERAEFLASMKQRAEERDRWSFINDESAAANFEHWSKTTGWEPEVAVALWLGKEPEKAAEALERLRGPGGSIFRNEYRKRLDYVEGAISVGELQSPISRVEFIAWAEQLGIEPPAELKGAEELEHGPVGIRPKRTNKSKGPQAQSSQQYGHSEAHRAEINELKRKIADTKTAATKEKRKLLQLLFVVVHGGYSYNQYLGNRNIVAEIRNDADLISLTIDHGTILERLTEAVNELPQGVLACLKKKASEKKKALPNTAAVKPNSA